MGKTEFGREDGGCLGAPFPEPSLEYAREDEDLARFLDLNATSKGLDLMA